MIKYYSAFSIILISIGLHFVSDGGGETAIRRELIKRAPVPTGARGKKFRMSIILNCM